MQRTRRNENAEDATLRMVQEHAAELLRFARRFSHCADDAHDAYQRALEILVRRMRVDPPAQPLPWLRTVLRHESLAIRAERERLLGRVELDPDRHEDRATADPAERAVGHERLRHTAEALRRLKPQEVTALVLRAEGLSYAEISARMGWTYTRTNRAVTEGRRALLERLGAIESGAECARWLPALTALADGEATADLLAQLRPHLRSCPACRATLRDIHAVPAQVALLVPPVVVEAVTHAAGSTFAGHAEVGVHAFVDRVTLMAARVQGAFEALPGAKLAAVAASTAAIAGGGVALERATQAAPASPAAAHASDDVVSGVSSGGLVAVAFLSRTASTGAPTHRVRPAAEPHGEFADGSDPPEFPPHAEPRAEFAAAADAATPPVAATVASSSTVAPQSVASSPRTGAPSEFGWP
jgi:RNA polymerase sigma factor (sigma-70 family)